MQSNKIRDAILVVIAIGLLVVVFLPTQKEDNNGNNTLETLAPLPDVKSESDARVRAGDDTHLISSKVSRPIEGVLHLLFPLVAGSVWEYTVTGPKELVPDETWYMELVKAPGKEEPGEIRIGFADQRESRRIWLDGGTVRTDALFGTEPIRFSGNAPTQTTGTFLPDMKYIIEDAVWTQEFKRQVIYESRDKRNNVHQEAGRVEQTDRARVRGKEHIVTPVGVYHAQKIEWSGRVEIFAEKNNRKVLADLTAAPYRTDSIWFASGIGMVRRTVEYARSKDDIIVFDLARYYRPEPEQPENHDSRQKKKEP